MPFVMSQGGAPHPWRVRLFHKNRWQSEFFLEFGTVFQHVDDEATHTDSGGR